MTVTPPGLIAAQLDLERGVIEGAPLTRRYLSDLKGVFADVHAYDLQLAQENPLIYTVSSSEPAHGDGQLHYGLGVLMPGQVGREYYLTKGHYHAWRPAAEVYLGLRGQGLMLLEDEKQSRTWPLMPESIVYVPGHTAHRTINTGTEPLIYLGIYPAAAGHDYTAIAERNFSKIVVEEHGQPTLLERSDYRP
jgi:glucose-6-phosphate isomerase, archaeal